MGGEEDGREGQRGGGRGGGRDGGVEEIGLRALPDPKHCCITPTT